MRPLSISPNQLRLQQAKAQDPEVFDPALFAGLSISPADHWS
jgi:hypothetical protein